MGGIGVALIGCGGIGKVHAEGLRRSPYAELKVACDLVEARARSFVEKFGFERFSSNYEEVLKADDVELVIIAVPPKYHAKMTIEALEAGKHVLCEKPMATNLKDAKEMLAKARKAGLKLCIDYQNRFLPSHERLKQIVDSGDLGDLIQVRARVAYPIMEVLPPDAPMRTWLFNPAIAGGGVLMDIGTHWTDLVRWLIRREYESVYALLGHFDVRIPEDVEDTAVLLCRMEGDLQAVVDVSWAVKKSLWLIEVYGSEGTAMANLPGGLLVYHKEQDDWRSIKVPEGEEPHAKLIRLFLKSIVEDSEPPVTGEDGYKSLEAVMAAYQSAKLKREISLPLDL
ncbi:MAG: Gfo/Idh/MocA family oxidoreductase [Thermoprotei archaeon]|nr:Gfo/Idh/MocA family oxidoreductase [Thermoprotei archaeon]